MYTYRKAKPEESEQCIELANYVFSTAHRPHDFETLLPKVYAPGMECGPLHRAAIRDDGRLRAELAVLPELLNVCGQTLRAGFIGTVCVHPKERGAGHMKRLMHDTLEELKGTCDLAVLDGQRQRYAYFGFTQGSLETIYDLNAANIRHHKKTLSLNRYRFLPVADADDSFLREFAAYAEKKNQERLMYAERPGDQILSILSSFQGRPVAVLEKENDQIHGYLLLSPGNEVTELSLRDETQAAAVLGSYLRQQGLSTLKVHLPLHQQDACASLSSLAEEEQLTHPGGRMFRIFSFHKVMSAFLTLKSEISSIVPGRLELWIDGEPLTILFDGKRVRTETSAAPGAVHLSCMEAQDLLLSCSMLTGRKPPAIPMEKWNRLDIPQGWFPLPLFWYPADTF